MFLANLFYSNNNYYQFIKYDINNFKREKCNNSINQAFVFCKQWFIGLINRESVLRLACQIPTKENRLVG